MTHFLKELDFTPQAWLDYVDLAASVKAAKANGREKAWLTGKHIALIFEKTSTRTRCAFEVAAKDQGAHTTYLDPVSSQIGHKESVADTARVLGQMFDGIEYRGDSQETVETLARLSGVPVFNGLTELWHPTQALADALTMFQWRGLNPHTQSPKPVLKRHDVPGLGRESSREALRGVSFAYLGDARYNTGNSMLINGAMLGADVRIIGPKELWPSTQIQDRARALALNTGAKITISDDIAAVEGAEFIHTDIWVSMGEDPAVWPERVALLRPYRVDQALLAACGRPEVKFMHCLPAYHDLNTKVGRLIFDQFGLEGLEVTNEVFESPASVVFDQAGNRMHTIKAVLLRSLLSEQVDTGQLLRQVWQDCGHGNCHGGQHGQHGSHHGGQA